MKNKKDLFKIIGLSLIVIIVAVFLAKHGHTIRRMNIRRTVKYIRSCGKFSSICFLLVYALKPLVLIIPASMLSLVGGILFGPVKGFILNMLGFFLSGSLAFWLSRLLGKSFVDKILRGRAVELDNNIEKEGFKIIFLLRFPPIFPYDPLSYASGLTKMKYKHFVLGSLLGVIPETLCYSYMGKNVMNPLTSKFIVPVLLVILTTIIGIYVYKKSKINVVKNEKL
ncbi:TVP38/TMEM64 family protein [Clostridium botulinum]|uniref:TVP38/TMEM64 family protein n=1 Tax=Clostridium botulinum TaxID=1491 RepID=UPI003DA27ACA